MRFEAGRFDALRERLLAGGIAPRRVKRYLAELDDHLAELTERERAAGYEGEDADIHARAMLGSDSELAESWLANPQLKSLTARAPWAVLPALLVLVLLLGFVLWIMAWAAVAYAGGVIGAHHHPPPVWFAQLSQHLSQSANFLMPPFTALVIMLLAWRQRLNALWTLLPTLLLVAVEPRMIIALSTHSLGVGFGLTPPTSALQIILVVTPTLCLMARQYWQPKTG